MLYQKYRPTKFEQVVGNATTVTSLKYVTKTKDVHTFLFTGPTGCGKTTLARIVAKELGASDNSIIEVDSAQFRGIDTIRDIRQKSQFVPLEGTIKVWIIDEVHQLSKDAQNAFLKILEDTPQHVYFILCTTDPQKLIKTIQSRCSTYSVEPLNKQEMYTLLRRIVKAENATLSKDMYLNIIKSSEGRPREAIQILEKIINVPEGEEGDLSALTNNVEQESIELCRALAKGASWKAIRTILKGLKNEDPERIRRHVLGYFSAILLNKDDERIAGLMEEFLEPFYNTGFPGLVYACYSCTK